MPVAHELAPTEPAGETAVRPLRTPIPAPCGQSPLSPRCWPAYAALRAANRRQIRETLEKAKGAELSFFERFCAKGDACTLSLISPFFWLLAGLSGHSAANRRQIRETPEKPRSKAQLFKRFCVWGTRRGFCPAGFLPAAGNRRWAFSPPGKTGAVRGTCTRNQPRACEAGQRYKHGA